MTDHIVFQLQDYTHHYGDQPVLHNIQLTVKPGEKIALLGPSGSGKSTLLSVLHQQQAQHCAWQPQAVSQAGALVEVLSVYHNIFMGGLERVSTLSALWNLIKPLAHAKKDVTAIAQQLGLEEKLWHSVDRLSGGQRQRVAMGRALYRQQPIYLADEPVSSVDPIQAQALLQYVLGQHQTAVVSLHNRRLALEHFDRIVVLNEGRICCDTAANKLTLETLENLYQQSHFSKPYNPSPLDDGWVIGTP